MNADRSYSSISRAKKREKLIALIDKRKSKRGPLLKKRHDTNSKNRAKESTKRKKLNSHFYEKLFRISGQQMKVLKDVNDIIVEESCLGSRHKKQRLCSGQECSESFHRLHTENKIKSGSDKLADFEEYWVPVHLSSMQMEQYCSILSSNLEALSSSSKNTPLHDILTQIQKCCDHPYLVDPALRNSSKKASLIDPLAAEINVSGKMQLLDKLLLEIKRCGLRALVLFHSTVNSEKISTGHFLDDLVHQRFGESSYVYIRGKILKKAKKKESLKMFNCPESERFICLFDRGCQSSIRLSRVDVVILFNSDVNPLNDIKALNKITIDSPREQLRVFRLYSTFTIEEKALILAKQGATVNYVKSSVCHQLLAWGVSYLFSKLQMCTDSGPLSSIDDLVHELSSLLRNTSVKTGPTNCSIVSNAHMQNRAYSGSILLFGEAETIQNVSHKLLNDNTPSVFWSNLIKESQQRLENSHIRLSLRVQKSPRTCFDEIRYDAATSASSFVRRKPRSKRKVHGKVERKQAGTSRPFGSQQDETQRESLSFNLTDVQLPILPSAGISDSVALNPRTDRSQQSQSDQDQHTSFSPLETEIERIQKEREQITKSHQEKKSMLLSECKKEISKVQKKYDALIHDSEVNLTNEIKKLEDYQKLVNANKLLADILARNWPDTLNLNQPELNLNRKQKETSSVNILEIPASALARPKTMGPTTYLHRPSLAGPVLRAPPQLRSNQTTLASFHNRSIIGIPILEPVHNRPIIGIPILEPLFTLSTAHAPTDEI